MSIWDDFDLIVSLAFTGYQDRAALMDKEIDRVGMRDVYRIWQFPCPFDKTIQDHVSRNRVMGHAGFFNSVIGHYRAIKTAYCLGAKRCLVMEDDIRFLCDLDLLNEVMCDIPNDYEFALLDVLKPLKEPMEHFVDHMKNDKVGKFWCKFVNVRSAGCYAMNRKGMERWLNGVESPALGKGGKMRLADQYFNLAHVGYDTKAYHAVPVAARQVLIGSKQNNSGFTDLDSYYKAIGSDPEAYSK